MKKKKVYIGMTADIMHHGLINIIETATKYGDVIIGLLTDKAVAEYKRLPILEFEHRKRIVSNIKGVIEVVAQEEWDYEPNLRKIRPDFMIHGDDWVSGSQKIYREKAFNAMKEWGGEIIEIPYSKGVSSGKIEDRLRTYGTTPSLRMESLRRLLEVKPLLRIMEVHHGLSGLLVDHLQTTRNDKPVSFDGMWSSSLTDSTSKGKPDIEAVDLTARLNILNEIFEITTKPMIYDADTGGKTEHFEFLVRSLERTGVSATIIEDKTGLKKNSLFGTDVEQTQETIENFCDKIKRGKQAQVTNHFMIFARIESLILDRGMDDAVKRAEAYIAAGADGIMIHSRKKNKSEILEFCRRRKSFAKYVPLVVVPTSYNSVLEEELIEAGVQICIYANHLLRSSYPAMLKTAESILKHGRSLEAEEYCMSVNEILELIPGTK